MLRNPEQGSRRPMAALLVPDTARLQIFNLLPVTFTPQVHQKEKQVTSSKIQVKHALKPCSLVDDWIQQSEPLMYGMPKNLNKINSSLCKKGRLDSAKNGEYFCKFACSLDAAHIASSRGPGKLHGWQAASYQTGAMKAADVNDSCEGCWHVGRCEASSKPDGRLNLPFLKGGSRR